MHIYRARTRRSTRQFFAFSPFARPSSPMTFKRRVFVAIMERKYELGLGLGQGRFRVRLELRTGRLRARLGILCVAFIVFLFFNYCYFFIYFCLQKDQKCPNGSPGSSPVFNVSLSGKKGVLKFFCASRYMTMPCGMI